jgi:endonuclease III
MKNNKEYSRKLSSFYHSLKRKCPKVQSISYKQVVDSIISGIISEKLSEKETESALKKFSEYFVDWNDLRVSRIEEIAEILGADTVQNREIALSITKVLQRIFDENHQISLELLQKSGKRQARQKLEKMEDMSLFAIDYCMLTALGSHAIPLTEKMIEYLKTNELVDKEADAQIIEGFLMKQISSKNAYEFYVLLRHESEKSVRQIPFWRMARGSKRDTNLVTPIQSGSRAKKKAAKKKAETSRKKVMKK